MSPSITTFDFSSFAVPTLLGPQKEFVVLHEKLKALVKSIPDDKEELAEDKEIWISGWDKLMLDLKQCQKEGAKAGHALMLSEAEIAVASLVVEMAQLFHDQLQMKKIAAEQVVKELEKGKGKEKAVEETVVAVEAAEEADTEEEEEAPVSKRKVHPTAKKSVAVVDSEVEQPMPKVGCMHASNICKPSYIPYLQKLSVNLPTPVHKSILAPLHSTMGNIAASLPLPPALHTTIHIHMNMMIEKVEDNEDKDKCNLSIPDMLIQHEMRDAEFHPLWPFKVLFSQSLKSAESKIQLFADKNPHIEGATHFHITEAERHTLLSDEWAIKQELDKKKVECIKEALFLQQDNAGL
ncbi:hypothetical protein BDR04DRAFT_1161461 [Suillus decipiens]|nr:hypothetical protein BDR04DRAFT_1161461 [Suillus decipiens]